nr:MAG: putative capsid protein [Hattula totivirus 2]
MSGTSFRSSPMVLRSKEKNPAATPGRGRGRGKALAFNSISEVPASTTEIKVTVSEKPDSTQAQVASTSKVGQFATLGVGKTNQQQIPDLDSIIQLAQNTPMEVDDSVATLQDAMKDGVVVAGEGIVNSGDLLVPLASKDTDVILIPDLTPSTSRAPAQSSTADEALKLSIAATRYTFQRMGIADDGSNYTDEAILQFLRGAGPAVKPPAQMEVVVAANGGPDPMVNEERNWDDPEVPPVNEDDVPPLIPPPNPDVPAVNPPAAREAPAPAVRAIGVSRISRVQPRPNRELGPSLHPAPPVQADGLVNYERPGGKLGDATVTPNEVAFIRPVGTDEYAQNIIKEVYSMLAARQERTGIVELAVQVNGVVALPIGLNGNAPLIKLAVDYPRAYFLPDEIVETKIVFENPVINGLLDEGVLREYVPEMRVESKKVAGTIRGEANMSNAFANAVYPLLREGKESYDLSAVFTVLHILIDYRAFIDKAELDCAMALAPAGAITICNIMDDAVGNASIVAATAAVHEGRICLYLPDLTPADISVLAAISTGPASLVPGQDPRRFIHARISSPLIKWLIWNSGAFVLPGAVVPTVVQLRATGIKLAGWLDAHDAYVQGYIRAQSILNVKLCQNGLNARNMFMSTLEAERISIPQPRGRHFIWTLLTDQWQPIFPKEVLRSEFDVITNRTTDEVITIGAVIASMVSLSVSSIFNHLNIGGRALNSWANDAVQPVTQFLRNMFLRRPTQCTVSIFAIMVNVLTQFTGFKISWTCFYTSKWSGSFAHRQDIQNTELWEDEWDRHVPYLLRPECLEWIIVKWLSVWGLSGPGIGYDLTNEVFAVGANAAQGLFIWRGDAKYLEAANSRVPFTSDPYGIFLINAIRQDLRIIEEWQFCFNRIRRSIALTARVDPAYVDDITWQPVYDLETYTLVPGTFLTYDWDQDCVMGPVLLKNEIGEAVWETVSHARTVLRSCAGYVGRVSPVMVALDVQGVDFERLFFGGGGGAAVAAVAAPAQAENMEN